MKGTMTHSEFLNTTHMKNLLILIEESTLSSEARHPATHHGSLPLFLLCIHKGVTAFPQAKLRI